MNINIFELKKMYKKKKKIVRKIKINFISWIYYFYHKFEIMKDFQICKFVNNKFKILNSVFWENTILIANFYAFLLDFCKDWLIKYLFYVLNLFPNYLNFNNKKITFIKIEQNLIIIFLTKT